MGHLPQAPTWEMAMGWEATPSHRLHKYKLGINEFSDMSPDEFAKTQFGYTKPEMPWGDLKNLGTHVYNGEPLADSVDWEMATEWEATPNLASTRTLTWHQMSLLRHTSATPRRHGATSRTLAQIFTNDEPLDDSVD